MKSNAPIAIIGMACIFPQAPDLAGFWRRLYPQVRKELSRRYPRHAWPETPA